MRKIMASLLALTIILTSFCMVSFADGNDIYFTEPTFNTERTEATVYLVVKTPATGMVAITVNYTVTGSSTYSVTDTGECGKYDSAMTMEQGTNVTFMGLDGIPAGTGELQIAKFVITKESADVAISIDSVELYDDALEVDFGATAATAGVNIKWAAPAPAPTPISPVANTEIKVGDTTYTDVVNFASSVSGSGSKLSFDLFENGTKHGDTYSVNLADWGLTIEEGTLNFKVAIIGAPSTGVTMNNITLGN